MANYRGVAVSSVIAKLLELCLFDVYGSFLRTSDLQFGFKSKLGCSNAIYTLRCVIDYYIKHNSTVNVCMLEMSKAFDKVNHHALFAKLMKRGVPVEFLRLLVNWYSKCFGVVKWNGFFALSCQGIHY